MGGVQVSCFYKMLTIASIDSRGCCVEISPIQAPPTAKFAKKSRPLAKPTVTSAWIGGGRFARPLLCREESRSVLPGGVICSPILPWGRLDRDNSYATHTRVNTVVGQIIATLV